MQEIRFGVHESLVENDDDKTYITKKFQNLEFVLHREAKQIMFTYLFSSVAPLCMLFKYLILKKKAKDKDIGIS